jgi:hypothetical protein
MLAQPEHVRVAGEGQMVQSGISVEVAEMGSLDAGAIVVGN